MSFPLSGLNLYVEVYGVFFPVYKCPYVTTNSFFSLAKQINAIDGNIKNASVCRKKCRKDKTNSWKR